MVIALRLQWACSLYGRIEYRKHLVAKLNGKRMFGRRINGAFYPLILKWPKTVTRVRFFPLTRKSNHLCHICSKGQKKIKIEKSEHTV
jgi:hypothetical protein